MIITCPNCNKQFKIDNSLIPNEGRDLQCGSCKNVWFYEIEEEKNQLLKLNDEIIGQDIKKKVEKKIEEERLQKKINNKTKEKIIRNQKNITKSKNIKNKGNKFFSYLIVFIISFVAFVILLDTLKNPLIKVFPSLEVILFNLFETLQDIKLFIIDLI